MGLLVYVINMLFEAMFWLIMIRVILSWVRPDPYSPIVQFIYRATEPILAPFRNLIPMQGIDLSPIFAIIVLQVVEKLIITLITRLL